MNIRQQKVQRYILSWIWQVYMKKKYALRTIFSTMLHYNGNKKTRRGKTPSWLLVIICQYRKTLVSLLPYGSKNIHLPSAFFLWTWWFQACKKLATSFYKKFFGFWQKICDRIVKTAFYVSRGTFWGIFWKIFLYVIFFRLWVMKFWIFGGGKVVETAFYVSRQKFGETRQNLKVENIYRTFGRYFSARLSKLLSTYPRKPFKEN